MNNFIIKTKNNLKNDKGDILEILKVIITSAVSLIVLFLLTKLVGNKQLSELNMFDYIVSITIGSIAAEMATELENPEQPLEMCIRDSFYGAQLNFAGGNFVL